MRSLYDNVTFGDSIDPQTDAMGQINGGTPINGSAVDTLGYNTAILRARVSAQSGGGSPSALVTTTFKLQESATSNGTFTDALDNTGAVIKGTVTPSPTAQDVELRIEGLGTLNRKRFLRVVETSSWVGVSSPSVIVFAEIVLGRAYSKPTNSTLSNT